MGLKLLDLVGSKISQAASYFDPSSNGGNNFWSTPVVERAAEFQQTNPLSRGLDLVKGFTGEFGANVQRAGSQNTAPNPNAAFTPENDFQRIGASALPLVNDFGIGQMSGINQSIDDISRLGNSLLRTGKATAPLMSSADDLVSKTSSKVNEVLRRMGNTDVSPKNRPGFANLNLGYTDISKDFLPSGVDKPVLGRTDVATLYKNIPEFNANPKMLVELADDGTKKLTFKGKASSFKIKPTALGLQDDLLNVGDNLNVESILKQRGTMPSIASPIDQTGKTEILFNKPAPKKKYLIAQKVDGVTKMVPAKSAEVVYLHPELETFVNKTGKNEWGLTEAKSGFLISSGASRQQVIADANNKISTHGVDKIKSMVDDIVSKRGTANPSVTITQPKPGVPEGGVKAQYDELLNRKIKLQQEIKKIPDTYDNTSKLMRLKSDLVEVETGMSNLRNSPQPEGGVTSETNKLIKKFGTIKPEQLKAEKRAFMDANGNIIKTGGVHEKALGDLGYVGEREQILPEFLKKNNAIRVVAGGERYPGINIQSNAPLTKGQIDSILKASPESGSVFMDTPKGQMDFQYKNKSELLQRISPQPEGGVTKTDDIFSSRTAGELAKGTENATLKTTERFFKPKGSKQVDFIAGPDGSLNKVTELGPRKTADLFRKMEVPTETKPGVGGQLPSGNVNVPPSLPPPGSTSLEEAIKKNASKTTGGNWYQRFFDEAPRFFKRVMPDDLYKSAKARVFDPLDASKGLAVDFKNKYIEGVKSLGKSFTSGSKVSELTQKFGEGLMTYDDIATTYGRDIADAVVKGDSFFRKSYDDILNLVNQLRTESGLSEIAKRKDYYRHMSEMSDGPKGWLEGMLRGGSLSGKSSSIMKTREGEKTVYDAVGGFIDYLDRSAQAGFIDRHSGAIRSLSEGIKSGGGSPELVKYLDDYANNILGIKNPLSGSETLNNVANVVSSVANVAKQNRVIGNVSSVLSQGLNIPLAAADMGYDSYASGLINMAKNKPAMSQSAFLKDRAFRIPREFVKGALNKAKSVGGALLQEADLAATRTIWSGFYEKAVNSGAKDAIKYADDMTRNFVGGRGVGDFSQAQRSGVVQLLAPFSLETQNFANQLLEMVGDKKYGALLGYMVTANQVNNAFERTAGYRPAFDPIDAAVDAYRQWNGIDGKEESKVKAVARLFAEGLGLAPSAQNIAVTGYQALDKATGEEVLPDTRDIFGSEDPTRFGSANMYLPAVGPNRSVITGNPVLDSVLSLTAQYSPTGYGNQIKKTAAGLVAGDKGYVESKSGNVLHPVEQDPLTRAQMTVFGPWSTEESRKYFEGDTNRPLDKNQSAVFKSVPTEDRKDFFNKTQAENAEEAKFTKKEGLFSNLFGGGEEVNFSDVPSSKDGRSAQKKALNEYMEKGGDISSVSPDVIVTHYFDGKTYDTAKRAEKAKMLKAYGDLISNEAMTDEQLSKIAESAKIDPDDFEYFALAKMPEADRLEGILQSTSGLKGDKLVMAIASSKRVVGGQALVNSTIVDKLYDRGVISKSEKALITAIKFDELRDEFYLDRDYKGEGLTPAQIKSRLNSINSVFKSPASKKISTSTRKISVPKLATPKMSRSGGSTSRWFKSY